MPMTLGGDGSATGLVLTGANLNNQQVTFSASANATTAAATSTAVKVNLGFEEFDSHGFFNPSTSRFQPTIAGYYFFTGQIGIVMPTAGTNCTAGLGKNGSVARWGNTIVQPGNRTSVQGMFHLNGTTDYVELFIFHTTGSTQNVNMGSDTTYLSGFLVRAA